MSDLPELTEPRRPPTPRWVKAFGILALVVAVLAVLRLTGVAGKGHGPGRHSGGQSDAGVGGPATPADASRTIVITALDSMAFTPAKVEVAAGETVTFEVTNTGTAVHEFTLGDAVMQQEHAKTRAHTPAGRSHDSPNSITLKPGETKRLAWRFAATRAPMEFACHLSDHYGAGMRADIVVT